MLVLLSLAIALLHSLRACCRSQREQALVELALRQQLAVLAHDRRGLIRFNVTTSPTARWVIQQPREAFPSDAALPFLVYDRDAIFSAEVTAAIGSLGTEPVRTAYRCPWQKPFAERWGRTCRRELLDHVVVLGERHLRRLPWGNGTSGGCSPTTSTTTTPSGSTRPLEIHPMGAPTKPCLRRAQGWSPSLARAACTIDTHGVRQLASVGPGPPEALDQF